MNKLISLRIKDELEQYRIEKPIGHGAQGSLYEVLDLTDNKRYALKQ